MGRVAIRLSGLDVVCGLGMLLSALEDVFG